MNNQSYFNRCSLLLNSLFPNQHELQKRWWDSPNKAFELKTPREVLDKEPEQVVQYLLNQFSGDYL